LPHFLGLRVRWVHANADPNISDLDVLEPSGLEPLQMVSVTMGRDDQIKPLFARYLRIGKLALEMRDRIPQELDTT
jgi:hypothetical protein